jgi:hypothetical protein
MVDLYEKWRRELWESDRDPKTKAKYWQVLTSYRTWLGERRPDIPSGKEYISYLREHRGYAQRTLLVYYHALSQFFESIGQTLRIKLRKPYTIQLSLRSAAEEGGLSSLESIKSVIETEVQEPE